MADSDKVITITPNTSVATTHPEIKFVGKDNSPMYLRVLDDNTLSFEGVEGQVFAMSPTMSSGDIFSVNDISGIQSMVVNADGTITIDAQNKSTTIKNSASNTATLILENTNADAIDGPMLEFYRNTPSPADGDDTGAIVWAMKNDNGDRHEYGRIVMEYSDASDGSEDGELIFKLTEAGSAEQEFMRLRGGSRQIELNTSQDDIDLCYNSDATADFFYINANTQRIGIGDAGTAPDYLLHLEGIDGGNGELFVERASGTGIRIQAQASFGSIGTTTNDDFGLISNGSTRVHVQNDGKVGIGTTSPASMLDVAGALRAEKTSMKNITGNTTLTDLDSGKTVIWTSGTLTLPATSETGQQFVIVNNTGSAATPGLGTSNAIENGWTAHSAMADETARTYIAPSNQKWIYIG